MKFTIEQKALIKRIDDLNFSKEEKIELKSWVKLIIKCLKKLKQK